MRRNGTKAKHGAATIGVPAAMLVLIEVIVSGCRDIVRMHREFAIRMVMAMLVVMVMMVLARKLTEFMGKLHGQVDHVGGTGGREGWRHRCEQIGDGDKPPQPSALRPPQATHLPALSRCMKYIALVVRTANKKATQEAAVILFCETGIALPEALRS
jgi:hypothetical protein